MRARHAVERTVRNAPSSADRYVAASGILMTGRSLLTGSMEDSFVPTIFMTPMRSYSAQTLPSQ
jgi:hypothetical protein